MFILTCMHSLVSDFDSSMRYSNEVEATLLKHLKEKKEHFSGFDNCEVDDQTINLWNDN